MIFKKIFGQKKQNNQNLKNDDEINNQINENKINLNEKSNISWFSRLKSRLKSSNSIIKNIFSIFEKSEIDYIMLEEMLLDFDIDYDLTSDLINKIKTKDKWGGGLNPQSAKTLIKDFMIEILKQNTKNFSLKNAFERDGMAVLIFCGINGAGKTTTIAKIGSIYKNKDENRDGLVLKPLFIACDIFRVAAFEQLEFWANKLDLEIYSGLSKDSDIDENKKKNRPCFSCIFWN
jgi:fused signal recognition particle receptor